MSKREYGEFVESSFNKSKILIFICGAFIALFELGFAISTIIDMTHTTQNQFRPAYLGLYIGLFLVTTISVGILLLSDRFKFKKDIVVTTIHIYDIIISFWALAISSIDVFRNQNYPIVFVTVMFALPFFLKIHYSLNTVILFAGTIWLCIEKAIYHGFTIGYTSNLLVFLIMGTLVSVLSYNKNLQAHQLELSLKELSYKDGLTKLYNRGTLDDKLEELAKSNKMNNIVMIDCDNFKAINDNFGHRVGDQALVEIALLIQREFGEDCFRYGGDEFVIITTFTISTVIDSIKQINSELKQLFGRVPVSISAGIYQLETGTSVENIISCADKALYIAKNTKKGSTFIYKD